MKSIETKLIQYHLKKKEESSISYLSECRMAGTANDYMGTLSKTRSGRICKKWPVRPKLAVTSMPVTSRSLKALTAAAPRVGSTVFQEYFNDTLYPEGSARNASNYCRNPSRNIAGVWCYTTDPSVPIDLCNVRDCEKPGKHYYYQVFRMGVQNTLQNTKGSNINKIYSTIVKAIT